MGTVIGVCVALHFVGSQYGPHGPFENSELTLAQASFSA